MAQGKNLQKRFLPNRLCYVVRRTAQYGMHTGKGDPDVMDEPAGSNVEYLTKTFESKVDCGAIEACVSDSLC